MVEDVSLGGDDVWVWSGCNGMTGQMLPVSGRKGGTEDLGGEGKVGEGKRSGRVQGGCKEGARRAKAYPDRSPQPRRHQQAPRRNHFLSSGAGSSISPTQFHS